MASKDVYTINYNESPRLSSLEAQVLSQYQFLAIQLNTLSCEIKNLNSTTKSGVQGEADYLLDNLRNLEVKIGLVYTQFKGAVYSLFLQHEENLNLQNDIEKQKKNESEDSDELDTSMVDVGSNDKRDDEGK